jgi:hypothetical protein
MIQRAATVPVFFTPLAIMPHIIMPPQHIIIGTPAAIIVIIRSQRSLNISVGHAAHGLHLAGHAVLAAAARVRAWARQRPVARRAVASVIDTVGDYALVMLLGRPLPTINFRVDHLRPAINTALIVAARVRRNGRSVGLVDVDAANEDGVLVAVGRACYATAN